MTRWLLGIAAVAVVAAAGWLLTAPERVPASALPPREPDLANGSIMFFAGGCASCHATPGAPDQTRLGGGLELKSSYGSFFVPNISPHRQDGIGAWSEADFASAMMKGTGPEDRHLYPSFPYGSYQRMRVDDVRDLFAFIRTLPEVPGRVRDHELKFPYSIRRLVGVWKRIYLDGRPFVPEPTHSAEWNRGAYLVNGPGHCAECHSPRTALGGIRAGQRFAGGPDPEGKGFVPNITQAAGGLAKWSVTEIEELLARGFTPEFDVVGGQMAAVVRNTGQLAPADRHAIAVYVKSLPPVDGPPKPAR